MTAIFDGMASVLTGVFGAAVTISPEVGADFEVEAILREDPVNVLDEDGQSTPVPFPTLQVRKPLPAGVVVGAEVIGADARRWRLINSVPSGSPAADAFVVFELERVTT